MYGHVGLMCSKFQIMCKHSVWRNYDDLNEYFWSVQCFRLGWPMRADDDFFCKTAEELRLEKIETKSNSGDQWMGKVNFVEIRSFWHIFRSFDRMWSFYILFLQAMIIIAWNGSGKLSAIFQGDVFLKVLSVFISAAILKLAQAVLDVALSWKARHSMSNYVKLRYVLKVGAAAVSTAMPRRLDSSSTVNEAHTMFLIDGVGEFRLVLLF